MLSEREVVALTIYGEARGEPLEGRVAVACVIRNRVRRPGWWGHGYREVCLKPAQFSCWNATDPNRDVLEAASQRLQDGETSPGDTLWQECLWIADGVMADKITDRVGQATHYYESHIAPPRWVDGATLVTVVAHHQFYTNVA